MVYAGWRIRNPFVDVAGKDYFYDAVLWGVENGVVKGMDETHFRAGDGLHPCTGA